MIERMHTTRDSNIENKRTPEEIATTKALILQFAKKDVPPEILGDYDVIPASLEEGGQGEVDKDYIYIDSSRGLMLEYKENLIALITYAPVESEEGSVICVDQLQGVTKKKEELGRLKWERLLVAALKEYAARIPGCKELRIPFSSEMYSYGLDGKPTGLTRPMEEHQAAMRMRYDVTAKRMGFILKKDKEGEKYWSSILQNPAVDTKQ